MKVKRKIRKFFTLNRRHEEGFTLVELIIVIAILAILGGAAVPIYAGYIEKANDAADLQLIAAVNTAFAAACMEGKVDVENVTEASVSLDGQKVYGLSTLTATETETSAAADINVIAPAFTRYYEGNEEAVFKKENVNSLVWNDAENTFELSEAYTSMRITLSNGKTVVVSAEDMAAIRASGFADMGVAGVTEALGNINNAGELLAGLVATAGKFDRLSAALVANGYMTQAEANALAADLKPTVAFTDPDRYNAATEKAANGLQMCVAEYIAGASDADVQKLLTIDLGSNSATGMVNAMNANGGTIGSSALAMQYGMANSFATSEYAANTTITVTEGSFWNQTTKEVSVSEYLATAEDPVAAIDTIQNTTGYQEYMASQQYQNDVNGLAGTLGVIGDNINSGTINTDKYLEQGVNGDEAQDVLGAVLGS